MTVTEAEMPGAERSTQPLTWKAFKRLLTLAAQPIKKDAGEPAPAESETSESHRPGGCSETHTHPSTTEDAGVRHDD